MRGLSQQPNWITNAPTSSQSLNDQLYPLSTLLPSSAPIHTRPTSSLSFKVASKSTSPICITPNTLAFVKKLTALATNKQCLSTSPMSHPPQHTTRQHPAAITTSPGLLPSRNTSPPSQKQPPPHYTTPTSPPQMTPHHPASPSPCKKPTKSTPPSPQGWLKSCSAPTPTLTTPSEQWPLDSSPPYTA